MYHPGAYHRSGPAEEVLFFDGSVDFLTAASAAHWFDTERFLTVAGRVLKTHGCIALLGYTDEFSMHYVFNTSSNSGYVAG